ncbi:MAG: hypothetical protein AAGI38_18430, partial [Bacteroidota bacterium]
PVLAATAVKDFDEALHRALQFAFRKTVGQRTLASSRKPFSKLSPTETSSQMVPTLKLGYTPS